MANLKSQQLNTSELNDLQTLKLALLDAIEYTHDKGDLKLSYAYENLLDKGVTPALKEALCV